MSPIIKLSLQASKDDIKSVTVFKSSKAEITRRFKLDLKKGQNKVEIRGLSTSIDTDSVRVSGLGAARLCDVVCRIAAEMPAAYTSTAAEVVRTLLVKKEALKSEKSMRELESNVFRRYAQTLNGEHVAPAQMVQFMEAFSAHGKKTVQAVTDYNEQIVGIERNLAIQNQKLSVKRGSLLGEVDLVILADDDGLLDLQLTYIVENARWNPTYELNATTEKGKPCTTVSLYYRAQVSQETGEDWAQVSLTLSTVSFAADSKQIPISKALKIAPKATWAIPSSTVPVIIQASRSDSRSRSRSRRRSRSPRRMHVSSDSEITYPTMVPDQYPSSLHYTQRRNEQIKPLDIRPITRLDTFVSETPVAASFTVPGESSIPSDGIEHQVTVSVLSFSANISYVTVPRLDPRMFLQCEVHNTSEYRLLPGPVIVILDGGYVSRTQINHVDVGDKFVCTLGDDPSTKIVYERSSKTENSDSGTFTEATKTVKFTTKVTVHNKHQFDIDDLVIRDAIPTCADSRIKILLRNPEGLAEVRDTTPLPIGTDGLTVGWEDLGDGKSGETEGRFEWKWKVSKGAKVTMEAEWEIKSAKDIEW
ncbi:hypothetical protein CPC08DRAFT_671813, partial [Agrocybe pediades]